MYKKHDTKRKVFVTRTVSQKMGVEDGMRAFFVNAPKPVVDALSLPRLDFSAELRGEFDYLHFFTTTQAEMDRLFPTLKRHLKATGMLWISWPKNRQLDTDLALPKVIEIGYGHGLVESTCLSVDTHWSGLKFTHPKKGKEYHNSFGQLPEELQLRTHSCRAMRARLRAHAGVASATCAW